MPSACAGTIQLGSFPHGPHGTGDSGFYIGTLPGALILAAICLVAFLLFNDVAVATARLHAAVVRALLSPLREAGRCCAAPGPHRTFIQTDTADCPHP